MSESKQAHLSLYELRDSYGTEWHTNKEALDHEVWLSESEEVSPTVTEHRIPLIESEVAELARQLGMKLVPSES